MQILKASEPMECPTFLLMKYVQKANHAYTKKDEISLKENAKLIVETICDMYLYCYDGMKNTDLATNALKPHSKRLFPCEPSQTASTQSPRENR